MQLDSLEKDSHEASALVEEIRDSVSDACFNQIIAFLVRSPFSAPPEALSQHCRLALQASMSLSRAQQSLQL